MKTYKQKKEAVRRMAINYQHKIANEPMSWWEMACNEDRFKRLGKRYGLLEEFRENGII